MKTYLVGGAVRDYVMGVTPKDRDYVVVGSTPEDMIAQGYQQVGASFPVFLKNGEEYALARTERKVGVGYHGFEVSADPSVTLEEDLRRRDLTMNAMAMDLETGEIIDPFGGRFDIAQGVIRHVSEAFAEDPVRVLRAARFAARYNFTIAHETVELMSRVVPELDNVSTERVVTEFTKGLMERYPAQMLSALRDVDANGCAALQGYCMYFDRAFDQVTPDDDISIRLALLCVECTKAELEKMKLPRDVVELVRLVGELNEEIKNFSNLCSSDKVDVLTKSRAFNDVSTITRVARVTWLEHCDGHGADITFEALIRPIIDAINLCKTVDTTAIAQSVPSGEIKKAIQAARIKALEV